MAAGIIGIENNRHARALRIYRRLSSVGIAQLWHHGVALAAAGGVISGGIVA
jgi:hypothetical protein